jgi:hypothetical protein
MEKDQVVVVQKKGGREREQNPGRIMIWNKIHNPKNGRGALAKGGKI